jgi:heme/copper-type cytochrome/quinol oxidase subunit 2
MVRSEGGTAICTIAPAEDDAGQEGVDGESKSRPWLMLLILGTIWLAILTAILTVVVKMRQSRSAEPEEGGGSGS